MVSADIFRVGNDHFIDRFDWQLDDIDLDSGDPSRISETLNRNCCCLDSPSSRVGRSLENSLTKRCGEPLAGAMTSPQHVYEVRPRKDRRGVDLISDALPFGRLCGGSTDTRQAEESTP
jgi:hypothetical protein